VGYLFVAPTLILTGIWFYYPLLQSLVYSFQEISCLNPSAARFVGIQNYMEIVQDSGFRNALKNSLSLTFIAVPLQSIFALIIAVNLHSIVRMRSLFR